MDEANQKIDVLWIPTLTLKSRYAVMCKKCKNGEFCSVEWASYLINQAARQDVIFESMAKERGWLPEGKVFQEADLQRKTAPTFQTKSVLQSGTEENSGIPRFFTCSNCGVTQMREGNFCSYCGNPAPEIEMSVSGQTVPAFVSVLQAVPSSTEIACPSCGNVQGTEGKFCIRCGQILDAEQRKGKFCSQCGAQLTEGMLFCMECGSKI